MSALALFLCCDFSSCWLTTTPLGIWVILTALSVVLTDCPPGPPALKTSIPTGVFNFNINLFSFVNRYSSSRSALTLSFCFWYSCTLWTLTHILIWINILTIYWKNYFITTSLTFRNIYQFQLPFFFEHTFSYILKRSAQKREASNPPVPAPISTIAFLLSSSSFGNKNTFKSFSYFSFLY